MGAQGLVEAADMDRSSPSVEGLSLQEVAIEEANRAAEEVGFSFSRQEVSHVLKSFSDKVDGGLVLVVELDCLAAVRGVVNPVVVLAEEEGVLVAPDELQGLTGRSNVPEILDCLDQM